MALSQPTQMQFSVKGEISMLRFNDGVEIDTSGELRMLRLSDGYYVVGQGYLIPVDDRSQALVLISKLKE